MKTPTFKEQFDKIVNAYLKNELEPVNPCGCFIGNLLNNKSSWIQVRDIRFNIEKDLNRPYVKGGVECIFSESNGLYTPEEIIGMEAIFMKTIYGEECMKSQEDFQEGEFEEAIYEAMEKAPLKLKEIHESKGEIVEDYTFTKRKLELAI